MCQLPETERPGWRNQKSSMKENNRNTTVARKAGPRVVKARSHIRKHSTDNVLKRQRPVDINTTEPEVNQDHGNTSPARYVAYHSQRSGGSPLAQHLLQSSLEKTDIEVEKRLSPPLSGQIEDCCSPPAKVQMSSQATYAGAKFHDPPSPKALPKPPNHWFNSINTGNIPRSSCTEMTNVIKVMLNVQS